MLVAMAGLPATGKSTIADELARHLGIAAVSVDPIELAILSAGIARDQPTGLAAYLVTETIAQSVLLSGQHIIVDAVNAVSPAREQWLTLAQRVGVEVRFIETVCSDLEIHRQRLAERRRDAPHGAEPSAHAVEQHLDEYSPWEGPSDQTPRLRLDTVRPLPELVEEALAFLRS